MITNPMQIPMGSDPFKLVLIRVNKLVVTSVVDVMQSAILYGPFERFNVRDVFANAKDYK